MIKKRVACIARRYLAGHADFFTTVTALLDYFTAKTPLRVGPVRTSPKWFKRVAYIETNSLVVQAAQSAQLDSIDT